MSTLTISELSELQGTSEQRLELNAFGTTDKYDRLRSIAIQLRGLILLEAGSMPNAKDMGVGIRLYLQDRISESLLSEIRQKIETNVRSFIPEANVIRSIKVEEYTEPTTGTSGILIWASINKDSDIGTESEAIAISVVSGKGSASEIVSKVYV